MDQNLTVIEGILNGIYGVEQFSGDELDALRGTVRTMQNGGGGGPVLKGDYMRKLFAKYANKIEDPVLQSQVIKGEFKAVQHGLYSTKYVGGETTIKMITADHKKTPGLSNYNMGKLDNNQAMVITHLQIRSGIAANDGDTAAEGKAVDFGKPAVQIVNGQFSLKVGNTVYADKCSCSFFQTSQFEHHGLIEWQTPFVINPNTDISWEIELAGPMVAKSWIRAELIGAHTIRSL